MAHTGGSGDVDSLPAAVTPANAAALGDPPGIVSQLLQVSSVVPGPRKQSKRSSPALRRTISCGTEIRDGGGSGAQTCCHQRASDETHQAGQTRNHGRELGSSHDAPFGHRALATDTAGQPGLGGAPSAGR